MKNLVGKTLSKKVKFLGEEVVIKKLNVAQVMEIQSLTSSGVKEGAEESDANSLNILLYVITAAVEGSEDISQDDLKQFPLDELSSLSASILEFSGLGNAQKK